MLVGIRGGEDDDGDANERGVSFDILDDFAAAFFGEVQVEDDKVRATGVGMLAAAKKKIDRICAVINHGEAMAEAGLFECFLDEKDIADIVFHPQYPCRRLTHANLFLNERACYFIRRHWISQPMSLAK